MKRAHLDVPVGHLHMKCSRHAALLRIPAPHLLKQEQLQLAGASFRDMAKAQGLDMVENDPTLQQKPIRILF